MSFARAGKAPGKSDSAMDRRVGASAGRQAAAERNPAWASFALSPAAAAPTIQPKLEVGAIDDPLERQADEVADQVMRMPDPAAAKTPTNAPVAIQRQPVPPTPSSPPPPEQEPSRPLITTYEVDTKTDAQKLGKGAGEAAGRALDTPPGKAAEDAASAQLERDRRGASTKEKVLMVGTAIGMGVPALALLRAIPESEDAPPALEKTPKIKISRNFWVQLALKLVWKDKTLEGTEKPRRTPGFDAVTVSLFYKPEGPQGPPEAELIAAEIGRLEKSLAPFRPKMTTAGFAIDYATRRMLAERYPRPDRLPSEEEAKQREADPFKLDAGPFGTQPRPGVRLVPPLELQDMGSPQLRRACTACEEEDEDKKLQAKPRGALHSTLAGGAEAPPLVHDVLRSPGQPLDAPTRAFFEPRFGQDFGHVRVHTDDHAARSAASVGASAYASGLNIAFAQSQYDPGSAVGRHLIAHELTHVVQQRSEPQPVRGSAPDRDIHTAGRPWELMAGAIRTALLLDSRHSVQARQNAVLAIQRTPGNKTVRRWPWSKTQTPERKAYEKSLEDLKDYRKDSHPNTPQQVGGFPVLGRFLAQYKAPIESLFVGVNIKFYFKDEEYQKVDEEDLARLLANKERRAPRLINIVNRWDPVEKEQWKRKFLTLCSMTWSFQHTLYCHKDWWESLKADVVVTFVDAGDLGAFSGVTVHKGIGVGRSNVRMGANAELNQSDIEGAHPIAAHEAGHMLGLGDEYQEKGAPEGERATHSNLVRAEFGNEVVRGASPDSIMAMSGAQKVLPQHGVVFLEAIRRVTKIPEWHLSPKPPRPEPRQ